MKAFTLIELLVTITIISVLYSIGIPIYEKQILKNRFDSEALVTIRAISIAQEKYKIETGRYYPYEIIGTEDRMYNAKKITEALKIDLKNTNNFLYGINTNNQGDIYTVEAILRKDNWDFCNGSDSDDIKCVESMISESDWVNSYSRGISKHYLTFTYPADILDYEHIFD